MTLATTIEKFPRLAVAVNGCDDKAHPDHDELELIERRTREYLAELIDCGRSHKSAMRTLCGALATLQPFQGRSRNAIRKLVTRWWSKQTAQGDEPESFGSRRQFNTGNHDDYGLPLVDWWRLVQWAVFRANGIVAEAWRILWQNSMFTEETMKHYGRQMRKRKSRVPEKVMGEVRWTVVLFRKWLTTTGYNSQRALVQVDHSVPIPPMLIMTADDLTPDFRYGIEVAPGRDYMTRGQILLFVDEGTMRIIGWVRTPLPSYNAIMILGELTRICDEIGVPAGCDWERGIWEKSNLLKGKRKRPNALSQSARECRLEKLGIRFKHCRSAQGKAIMERVVGFFQTALAAVPGWTGNDEKETCPDDTKDLFERVNSGKLRAREAGFYYETDDKHDERNVDSLIRDIVTRYNATRQQGKILDNLSPDEAWSQFFNPDYLITKFTPALRHALIYDFVECKTTMNGVRPYSSGPYFWNEHLFTHFRIGQMVRVRANVLDWSAAGELDEVVISDLDDQVLLSCTRRVEAGRADWILDPELSRLKESLRECASLEASHKALLKQMKPKPKFHVLPQPPGAELLTRRTIDPIGQHEATGRAIGEETSRTKVEAERPNRLASAVRSLETYEQARIGDKIHDAVDRSRADRDREAKKQAEEDAKAQQAELAEKRRKIKEFERTHAHLLEGYL